VDRFDAMINPAQLMSAFEEMSLTQLIRLQNELSQVLTRRFERPLALAISDIVGSTQYFARFGDEAGSKLQQWHLDLLQQVLVLHQGRLVDTAGDGALTCFPAVEQAADAMVELQTTLSKENFSRARDHQLTVRIGLHYGPVLTDDVLVKGEAINLCARIASTASGAEIRLTRQAFQELSIQRRLCCRALSPTALKGFPAPVEILVLEWRDRNLFPSWLRIEESDELLRLPDRDTVTCGRLKGDIDMPGNDIVLALPDPGQTKQISRWHFELRRHPDGLFLSQVSDGVTEVDGELVPKGGQARVRPGTVVRVGNAMTLRFMAAPGDDATDMTIAP
jgi:class 3 adenylate cyclase